MWSLSSEDARAPQPSRHHGDAQSPQTASSQHARGRRFSQETTDSRLSPSGVLGVRTGHQGNLTSGAQVCTHIHSCKCTRHPLTECAPRGGLTTRHFPRLCDSKALFFPRQHGASNTHTRLQTHTFPGCSWQSVETLTSESRTLRPAVPKTCARRELCGRVPCRRCGRKRPGHRGHWSWRRRHPGRLMANRVPSALESEPGKQASGGQDRARPRPGGGPCRRVVR